MAIDNTQTFNAKTQADITPHQALDLLKEGNKRFVANGALDRDTPRQIKETVDGQWPHSVVLSCIDSRVPVELAFDQGIGDLFVARVAGNIVNEDVLGSIEYGCKYAGSKLVVVLGHTQCGAVKGACDDLKDGNLTELLSKIRPAVEATETDGERNSGNKQWVDDVVRKNVEMTIKKMKQDSDILSELAADGDIKIVGGIYNLKDGAVEWL